MTPTRRPQYCSYVNKTVTPVRAAPGTFAPAVGLMLVSGGKLAEAAFDEALEGAGFSLAKMWGLRQLTEAGKPLTLRAFAERMGCAKSNASTLADRLQAQGLLQRCPDPIDRRGVLLELTPAGNRGYATGVQLAAAAEPRLLSALSQAERQLLAELLTKFGSGETPN